MIIYSTIDIAEELYINPETVRRWCREGKLKCTKTKSMKIGNLITPENILESEIYKIPKYQRDLYKLAHPDKET